MALASLVYALVVLTLLVPADTSSPNLVNGMRALITTPSIVILEGLWVAIFLYLRRSPVTTARMSFHVECERV
jgi:hypothetical protein